jgi:hypothetical protein
LPSSHCYVPTYKPSPQTLIQLIPSEKKAMLNQSVKTLIKCMDKYVSINKDEEIYTYVDIYLHPAIMIYSCIYIHIRKCKKFLRF